MSINNKIYTAVIMFIFLICPGSLTAKEKTVSAEIVRFDQGKLVINAQKTPLGKILDEIYLNCMVKIIGLGTREKEQITFTSAGQTTEDVLKRLLRHLNENNYAFEYNNEGLVKISVLPKSKTKVSSHPDPKPKKVLVNAVRVQNTVEGTQADELGLRKGDYIISYDGIQITSAQQLVMEVRKRAESDNIELIVMRDREPMSFIVKGGLIGVNINTVKISKEDLGE